MSVIVDDAALDVIFRGARTHNAWQAKPVGDALLQAVWELAKLPPTSANCSPARILFVRSPEAKARLVPLLLEGNRAKTAQAPVTAIIGYDLEFYENLPRLFPHTDARAWFVGNPELIHATAFRNGTLQGAYLMLAARALGLDCGPMSGFDNDAVDAAFFPDGRVKSNFLCNLGYGDPAGVHPRNPRLAFAEACKII
jgi:3-hydroxypropanoate dehydrogenase